MPLLTPEVTKLLNESVSDVAIQPPAVWAGIARVFSEEFARKYSENSAMSQGLSQVSITTSPKLQRTDPFGDQLTPFGLLELRMTWPNHAMRGEKLGVFGKVKVCAVVDTQEGYVIFCIIDGKPVTLTDTRQLFPSDTLITKLKMASAQ